MLLRLKPRRDEAAALAFEDVASQLDAGLTPAQIGGDPAQGEAVLSSILARRQVDLEPMETAILTAAFKAGRAPIALRHLAEQRQMRAQFAGTLLRGLRYPLALGAMAVVTTCITASLLGKGVLAVVLAVLAATAVLLAFGLRGLAGGREPWISLPGLAGWAGDLAELPYLEVLRGLYGAGVPLLQAHPAAVAACPVVSIRHRLEQADRTLQQGRPLAEALALAETLHPETRQVIANGESTGGLEEALHRALDRRRTVGARRTAALARGLSTLVYVVAAGIAVYVIFSFYGGYFAQLRALR